MVKTTREKYFLFCERERAHAIKTKKSKDAPCVHVYKRHSTTQFIKIYFIIYFRIYSPHFTFISRTNIRIYEKS